MREITPFLRSCHVYVSITSTVNLVTHTTVLLLGSQRINNIHKTGSHSSLLYVLTKIINDFQVSDMTIFLSNTNIIHDQY